MQTINKIIGCIENVVMIILMSVATIVAIIQVIARYIFSSSLYWSEETILYALISMSFIAASMGIHYGAHISVEIINTIPSMKIRKILNIMPPLLGIIFASSIIFYGYNLFIRTLDMYQLSPAMQIPVAYIYAIIPLSGIFMLLRYINVVILLLHNSNSANHQEKPFSV